jgi:predicted negative regulator of RcsB-dependent stress response
VSVARILAAAAAVAFVLGLAGVFGWTYREQSHTVSRLTRERAALRAQNRRLASNLASAQSALTTLNVGLDQTRRNVAAARAAARVQAGTRWLDGYAAGFLWALGADPYGAVDTPDAGSSTGWFGR